MPAEDGGSGGRWGALTGRGTCGGGGGSIGVWGIGEAKGCSLLSGLVREVIFFL